MAENTDEVAAGLKWRRARRGEADPEEIAEARKAERVGGDAYWPEIAIFRGHKIVVGKRPDQWEFHYEVYDPDGEEVDQGFEKEWEDAQERAVEAVLERLEKDEVDEAEEGDDDDDDEENPRGRLVTPEPPRKHLGHTVAYGDIYIDSFELDALRAGDRAKVFSPEVGMVGARLVGNYTSQVHDLDEDPDAVPEDERSHVELPANPARRAASRRHPIWAYVATLPADERPAAREYARTLLHWWRTTPRAYELFPPPPHGYVRFSVLDAMHAMVMGGRRR